MNAADVTGPQFTCPNSVLTYYYDDSYACGNVEWTIDRGQIYNEISQQWVSYWSFDRSQYTYLNNDFPFSSLGSVGNVSVRVCHCSIPSCGNGDLDVTFGPSPGTPIISGASSILNCIGEEKTFTTANVPPNWGVVQWSVTSDLQLSNQTVTSTKVEGINTTANGMETLTAQLRFRTDGNSCGAAKYANRDIWLGKPAPKTQTVNGSSYYPGSTICPGNNWVGMAWNGNVTSTSWSINPGIVYSTTNTELDFTLPYSGYSSISISVNGSNTCGTSYNASYYLSKATYGCGSFMMASFPNPASDEISLTTSVLNENDGVEYEVVADEIVLVDYGNKKHVNFKPKKSKNVLDVKKLKDGNYFLKSTFGDQEVTKQIIIKK